MDVGLKDQIAQVLSPDVARQLASTVGMDAEQGKAFISAAIPSLLAAFLSATEREGGAKALSDAVSNSDPNALERLRRALAAHDLQPLSEGANTLTPVLGQAARDRLANGLADHVETPIEAAMPALGAVEQAVVAVIGQQDPLLWSDGESIRSFLNSERASILSGVPASLSGTSAAAPRPAAPPPPPPPPAAASTTPGACAADGCSTAATRAAAASAGPLGGVPDVAHHRHHRADRGGRLLLLAEDTSEAGSELPHAGVGIAAGRETAASV